MKVPHGLFSFFLFLFCSDSLSSIDICYEHVALLDRSWCLPSNFIQNQLLRSVWITLFLLIAFDNCITVSVSSMFPVCLTVPTVKGSLGRLHLHTVYLLDLCMKCYFMYVPVVYANECANMTACIYVATCLCECTCVCIYPKVYLPVSIYLSHSAFLQFLIN